MMLTSCFRFLRDSRSILFAPFAVLVIGLTAVGQDSAPTPEKAAEATSVPPAEEVEELKKADTPAKVNPATEVKTSKQSEGVSGDPKSKSDSTDDKSTEQKPAAKNHKKTLQQTVQDALLGEAKQQIENPVEAILERMRNVQERLTKTATDKVTRQEQTEIVQQIDKLIEALKNQPPPSSQSSSSNSNSPPPPPMGGSPNENQQAQGTPQPKPRNSAKQQQDQAGQQQKKEQGQNQKQPGQTESVADKARDSNSSSSKRPRSAEEEAARQRMIKDVWGHLPHAARLELLNILGERYIPKYDEQVRRYYEALAEENRGTK